MDEGLADLKRAVELRREALGPEHPSLARKETKLGLSHPHSPAGRGCTWISAGPCQRSEGSWLGD